MKFRSISYYIREAFKSISRNRLMSLAAMITVASCIFILSVSYCLAANIDYILKQVEDSLTMMVYIEDTVSTEKINKLYSDFKAIPNVSNVVYIPAQDALEKLSSDLGAGKEFAKSFAEDNPLPRSFEISITEAVHQEEVLLALEGMKEEGIEGIRHDSDISEALTSVNSGIRIVSIIIILILGVISVVIIVNTIKITVNSRKTEINIMKYVGATDWFIRWPFIIEGMLIGLIGSAIPLCVFWTAYGPLVDMLHGMPIISGLILFLGARDIFIVLAPLSTFLGILIGVTGSVTSIRKHLKV